MAKPPLHPLKDVNGKGINYFEKLVVLATSYLKGDNIELSFEGYRETYLAYANLNEAEREKAWILAKELNSWAEYFSSIANLIQKYYLDAETHKMEIQSSSSIQNDAAKVANGDRLSNKDPQVVDARLKRNTLKAFYDELVNKVKFLERAYYHCKNTCEWSNQTPNPGR